MKKTPQNSVAGKSALKSLVKAVAVAAISLIGTKPVSAAVTYEYTGLNFTTVTGSAPQITTANHISGFVTFDSEPTPGGTLQASDVVAFSLTDGARTTSSATSDRQSSINYFTFDTSLRITDWAFYTFPAGSPGNGDQLSTLPTRDFSRLDIGNVQSASNNGGGSWSAVPEPGSLSLLAVGAAAMLRRKRR